MHVVLDARGITEQTAGVARYAMFLVPRLIAQRPDWRWTVIRHASNREPLGYASSVGEVYSDVPIDSLRNHLWGPGVAWGDCDVFHSLFQVVPPQPRARRVVVTAHDFIDMDHPSQVLGNRLEAAALGAYARTAFRGAMRRADHVIAISEHVAVRARRLTEAEVTVVGHGVEPRYFEPPPQPDEIVRWLRRDGRRYVVAVGNDKPYKNLGTLLRAFAHARPAETSLALVGNCDGLRPLAAQLRLGDRAAFLGFLGDEDLRRVLGHADAYVFPSTLEGFGMPPLEAMALGVPTLVSDVEPMKSVCGDAALRFEPTDVYALAELISQVLGDADIRATMIRQGRAWARRFDWDETASATLAVYEGNE